MDITPPHYICRKFFIYFGKLNNTRAYEQTEIQQSLAYRLADHGVIFLVFAILWAVIYFNELKKFKKNN